MNLKELLDHIIDGADFLVSNNKTYSAAMLASMSIEIMGRLKIAGEDFLTKNDDAASLFRNALKNTAGLDEYSKLVFESKNYSGDSDKEIADHAKELSEKKKKMKDVRTQLETMKADVSKTENKLYELLKRKGRGGKKFDLYYALRCGFAHNCLPGERLGLTDKLDNHSYCIDKEKNEYVLGVKNLIENLKKAKTALDSSCPQRMGTDVLEIYERNVFWQDPGTQKLQDEQKVVVSACLPKQV